MEQRAARKRVGDRGPNPNPLGTLSDRAERQISVPVEEFDRVHGIETRPLGAHCQFDIAANASRGQDQPDSHFISRHDGLIGPRL
jgi:hypothetical protein